MVRSDPAMVRVGRYPALTQWIERFLHGEFPYRAEARPSGLPFLFLLEVPFYLLGEPGLLQVTTFLAFSAFLLRRSSGTDSPGWTTVFLLAISPAYLYEVTARSDLFSNMVLLLLYGLAMERTVTEETRISILFLLGAAGGFLMSTRIVTWPIYFLILGLLYRRLRIRLGWLLLGNILGFVAVTLPFLLWEPAFFFSKGPLRIQASYLPLWAGIPIGILTLFWSSRVRSIEDLFSATALLLFLAVLLPFIQSAVRFGWSVDLLGDRFDISYFTLCLPFTLLSLDTAGRRASPAIRAILTTDPKASG